MGKLAPVPGEAARRSARIGAPGGPRCATENPCGKAQPQDDVDPRINQTFHICVYVWTMTQDRTMAGFRFQSLQAGRGLAALAVVLYHAADTITLPKYIGPDPTGLLAYFLPGHAGVHYFFVLSGFVIYHVHGHDRGAPAFSNFIWKRTTRLVPALWVWLAVVTTLLYLQPGAAAEAFGLRSVLQAFSLIPVEQEVVLKVEWTLRHEMLFYVLYALYVLYRPLGAIVLSTWFAGSLISHLADASFPYDFVFSPFHLLFLSGIGIAHVLSRRRIPAPHMMVAAGFVALAVAWLRDPGYRVDGLNGQLIGFGAGATLMIAGLTELDRQHRLPYSVLLGHLGDASYSLYLTNLTIISASCKVATIVNGKYGLPPLVWFCAAVATSVAFGWLFHRYVERPLLRMLQRGRGHAQRNREALVRWI